MDQIKVHFIQIQIRNQITTTIHPTTDGFPNRAVILQEIRWVFCNARLTKNFLQMSSQLLNDKCELRPFFRSHARTLHVQIKVRTHTCAHTQFEVVALRSGTFGKITFSFSFIFLQFFNIFMV